KEIGVQISIDDFGTGYSSLSYLKHFPFDNLKIDRSFINNVTVDPNDAAIALTIISMAHSLKLKAIAEGVETEGQLLYLARQGCDEIQGYYFCKPLPEEAATQLLEQDKRLIFNALTEPSRQTGLIVDDDPVVVVLLSRLLEQDNYKVLSANSARAGLELLATHPVEVVVSDQVMPEMDGIEFLSRVKELHLETVRIILTGHVEPETITKAVNRGWIYKFISKPWDDEDLLAQVREAFTRHHRLGKKKSRPLGKQRKGWAMRHRAYATAAGFEGAFCLLGGRSPATRDAEGYNERDFTVKHRCLCAGFRS
ncbi:MAG: EAL domain-containing protein, partial [Gammaproteobacteria bacterium]